MLKNIDFPTFPKTINKQYNKLILNAQKQKQKLFSPIIKNNFAKLWGIVGNYVFLP